MFLGMLVSSLLDGTPAPDYLGIPGAAWIFIGGLISVYFGKWVESRFQRIQKTNEAAIERQKKADSPVTIPADPNGQTALFRELLTQNHKLGEENDLKDVRILELSLDKERLSSALQRKETDCASLANHAQKLESALYHYKKRFRGRNPRRATIRIIKMSE